MVRAKQLNQRVYSSKFKYYTYYFIDTERINDPPEFNQLVNNSTEIQGATK